MQAPPGTQTHEGTSRSPSSLPATGELRALLLLVDFVDAPGGEDPSALGTRFTEPAESWVSEVSYGRLELAIDSERRWFRMPSAAGSYGPAKGFSAAEQDRFLREAVAAADPFVDFSSYAAVYVLPARGSGLRASSAYMVRPGNGIRADGNEIRHGATLGGDARAPGKNVGARVLVHETGHLLGLPDLYDTQNLALSEYARFAGAWDVMSVHYTGAHFMAWHKWKLGWLSPEQLRCVSGPGRLVTTLTSLARPGGVKSVVVETGPTTALVIEARRKNGSDASLCEEGVVVYAVDSNVPSGRGPIRVRPAQRDRSADRVQRCGRLYNAPLDRARGEVRRLRDRTSGVTVEVLASHRNGYTVRVSR